GGHQLLLGVLAEVPGAVALGGRLQRRIDDQEAGAPLGERPVRAADLADDHDLVPVPGLFADGDDALAPGGLTRLEELPARVQVGGIDLPFRRPATLGPRLRAAVGPTTRSQGDQGGEGDAMCEAEHERYSLCEPGAIKPP